MTLNNDTVGHANCQRLRYLFANDDVQGGKNQKTDNQRAGIAVFRWHDLRHTWASWQAQRGTSLQELQELEGWATFEMVLRHTHLATDHLKPAGSRIKGTILAQSETSEKLELIVSS